MTDKIIDFRLDTSRTLSEILGTEGFEKKLMIPNDSVGLYFIAPDGAVIRIDIAETDDSTIQGDGRPTNPLNVIATLQDIYENGGEALTTTGNIFSINGDGAVEVLSNLSAKLGYSNGLNKMQADSDGVLIEANGGSGVVIKSGGVPVSILAQGGDASFGSTPGNNTVINSTGTELILDDAYQATPKHLSDASNTDLTTTNKTIIGAINEVNAGGEANTSSNSGTGVELAKTKVGVDLPFRTLVSSDNTVSITQNTDTIDIKSVGISANATSIQSVAVDSDVPVDEAIQNTFLEGSYIQNLAPYSNSLDNANWYKTAIASIDSATGIKNAFYPTEDLQGIISDSTTASHLIQQINATTINEGMNTISVVFKKGSKQFAYIWLVIGTDNYSMIVDLAENAIKMNNGSRSINGYKLELKDGQVRVSFDLYVKSTSILDRFKIYPLETYTGTTSTGDSVTVDLYAGAIHVSGGVVDNHGQYEKTAVTIQSGKQGYLYSNSEFIPVEKIVCLGDSITYGYDNFYAEYLDKKYTDKAFLNFGQSGSTSLELICNNTGRGFYRQLLHGLTEVSFDFLRDTEVFPFLAGNGATIEATGSRLKITQNATANASARLLLFNDKEVINLVGTINSDGTAIPIIKNGLGTVLWAGSTDTSNQTFNINYETDSTTDEIVFVVDSGANSNYIELTNVKIQIRELKKPNMAIVLIGINDVLQGYSISDTEAYIQFIHNQILRAGIKSVAIQLTPSQGFGWTTAQRTYVIQIEDFIKNHLKCSAIIDTDEMGDSDRKLLTNFNSGDNLHPSNIGQKMLGQIIAEQGIESFSLTNELDTYEPVLNVDSATITVSADNDNVLVDYTATGVCTVTIPSAEIVKAGRSLTIIDSGGNAGTNAITIETEGSETISGQTNATILTDYGTLNLISNGVNLYIK